MPRPNVVVRLDRLGRGDITIDGKRVDGVRAVTVKAEINCLPVVVVEMLAGSVDLQHGEIEGVPDAAAQQ